MVYVWCVFGCSRLKDIENNKKFQKFIYQNSKTSGIRTKNCMMAGISKKAKLVADAKRELMGLKTKKAKVTTNLNKCQHLLDLCREENPLTKTSAEATKTQYNLTKFCFNNLEESEEKYLDILVSEQNDIIEQEDLSAVDKAEVDKMQVSIDKHMENIDEYFNKVLDIRKKNINTFYAIDAPPLVLRGVTEAESDFDPDLKLDNKGRNRTR